MIASIYAGSSLVGVRVFPASAAKTAIGNAWSKLGLQPRSLGPADAKSFETESPDTINACRVRCGPIAQHYRVDPGTRCVLRQA